MNRQQIARNLLAQAEAKPGECIGYIQPFIDDTRVGVKLQGGVYTLQIRRAGQMPSQQTVAAIRELFGCERVPNQETDVVMDSYEITWHIVRVSWRPGAQAALFEMPEEAPAVTAYRE